MTKQIWLNLPVKDVKKSKEFFTKIGFSFNATHGESDHSACMIIGDKNFVIMLFSNEMFASFSRHEITDTTKSSEVLISIDAESREGVDEITNKAEAAGGTVFGKPTEIQGWMYGSGFTDLDGHRWNVLYMDMSKMPK